MKKIVLFALAACFTVACGAQDLSKTIVNALNEPVYARFSGSCYLKTSAKSLLLMFNTTGSSDSYDRNILLMAESELHLPTIDERATYEVFIPQSRRYLALYNHSDKQVLVIGLSDKEATQQINRFSAHPDLGGHVSAVPISGYGLSFMVGLWNIGRLKESAYKLPFNTLDYSDALRPDLAGKMAPPALESEENICAKGKCTSGGAGSSSCSLTEFPIAQSCTVTCNSGYYSCCNSSTVRCYCCRI